MDYVEITPVNWLISLEIAHRDCTMTFGASIV